MKIGIDISQIVYEGTGVAEYVEHLVETILEIDHSNEYIFFFAHWSKQIQSSRLRQGFGGQAKFKLKSFRIPIILLEFLWNRLHIFPIEWLIGKVDVFFTSDWVEPPTRKAKKVTTIHDLSVLKLPETFDRKIVDVHKRKLAWVVKESNVILCDSNATKNDAKELLGIDEKRLRVVYPGTKLMINE